MIFDEEWNARQMEKLRNEYREEGLEIGREKGREEGREEGITLEKHETIKVMLEEGYDDAQIIKIARITPEALASLKEQFIKSETH